MSTNASISIRKGDTIESIYSHYDGYIEHLGKILQNNFKTEDDVQKLIDLGNISFFSETKDDRTNNEINGIYIKTYEEPKTIYKNSSPFIREYNYIFQKNKWVVIIDDIAHDLENLIKG